jgi:hypothetical protein
MADAELIVDSGNPSRWPSRITGEVSCGLIAGPAEFILQAPGYEIRTFGMSLG